MESNLKEFLESQFTGAPFQPYHHISPEADALTVYFKGDADYSQRLTDHVTLYRSLDTNEIVGCRIKGISGILEDLPNYLQVNHQGGKLSMIFWAFRGSVDDDPMREVFKQLNEAAGEMPLPTL